MNHLSSNSGRAAIITGAQGCGKTRHGAALAVKLGCSSLVDEWMPGDRVVEGALHLTHADLPAGEFGGATVYRFADLMPSAGGSHAL